MNNKSEKIIKTIAPAVTGAIIKTIAPAVTGAIILVGKAAGKMKEEINNKLPNTKVISVNSDVENGKDRETMKRDIVRKLATISIPVIAAGIPLLIKSFRYLDENKKINDEINNIDVPCGLEDLNEQVDGSTKDRSENAKKVSTLKNEVAKNISKEMMIVLKHKSIEMDLDELIYALHGCIDLKEKNRLMQLIISYNDIGIAKTIAHTYNNIINKYGINQMKYMILTHDCIQTIYNTIMATNITSIITKTLDVTKVDIDETTLASAVLKSVSCYDHGFNDGILLLKLFEDYKIDPAIQIKVLIKVHDYLESINAI